MRGGGRLLTKGKDDNVNFNLTFVVPQYSVYCTLAHIIIYRSNNARSKMPISYRTMMGMSFAYFRVISFHLRRRVWRMESLPPDRLQSHKLAAA